MKLYNEGLLIINFFVSIILIDLEFNCVVVVVVVSNNVVVVVVRVVVVVAAIR